MRVIPDAGHLVNVTPRAVRGMGAAELAGQLYAFRFVPGYLDDMAAWVNAEGTGNSELGTRGHRTAT